MTMVQVSAKYNRKVLRREITLLLSNRRIIPGPVCDDLFQTCLRTPEGPTSRAGSHIASKLHAASLLRRRRLDTNEIQ